VGRSLLTVGHLILLLIFLAVILVKVFVIITLVISAASLVSSLSSHLELNNDGMAAMGRRIMAQRSSLASNEQI
jgi:hypothetical protein